MSAKPATDRQKTYIADLAADYAKWKLDDEAESHLRYKAEELVIRGPENRAAIRAIADLDERKAFTAERLEAGFQSVRAAYIAKIDLAKEIAAEGVPADLTAAEASAIIDTLKG